jgi:hypothetical protein
VARAIPNEPMTQRPRTTSSLPRPGLEALRLYVHGPDAIKQRFVAPYFTNEVQRDVFDALATGQSLSELIDALERRGQDEAALVLSELAVEEVAHTFSASEVTAVVAQLVRSAVREELRSLDRDMREGRVSPEVAMATTRDVKERVELLEGPNSDVAEADLRQWLVERASLPTS